MRYTHSFGVCLKLCMRSWGSTTRQDGDDRIPSDDPERTLGRTLSQRRVLSRYFHSSSSPCFVKNIVASVSTSTRCENV